VRTLVIGLDAATWSEMTPLIQEGKLPNIRMLIDGGASGTLTSTIPPMTPSAWTSIATGVNPGKHGIYDFVRQTYRIAPINYSYLKRPAIWDIFNAYGKNVGVVNFPLAFPPPKVESFFISGLASPELESCAYPSKLWTYLRSKGYRVHPKFRPEIGVKQYFDEVKDLTKIQCEVTIELMKRWDWELFWVVFQALDWVQHYLWKADVDGENAVQAFYRYLDTVVGKLVQEANDDWNIVVLSDHGFLEIKAEIHLNTLLEEWGYLKRRETSRGLTERITNFSLQEGRKLGRRLPLALRKWVKRRIGKAMNNVGCIR
jgi:predicted AlkP superfamily phosphohydrolase/phosphomutase